MTVIAVHKDPQALTMTIEAEFDASPERVWQLRADPRQLERWWGPPSYPATVTKHNLTPGGRVEYQMTGPEGDQHRAYWNPRDRRAASARPQRRLREHRRHVNTDLSLSTMYVRIEGIGGRRTRMAIEGVFPSAEAMEQILAMGTEEGMTLALGQIDAILAEDPVARR